MKNNKIKRFGMIVLGALTLMGVATVRSDDYLAHKSYHLSVTANPKAGTIDTDILFDSNGAKGKHLEVKKTDTYFGKYNGVKTFVSNEEEKKGIKSSLLLPQSKFKDKYIPKSESLSKVDYVLPFAFPGRHVGDNMAAKDRDKLRDGNAIDRQMAQNVQALLVGGFNQALSRVLPAAYPNMAERTLRDNYAKTVSKLSNTALLASSRSGLGKTQTTTIGAVEVKISPVFEGDSNVKGMTSDLLKASDFVGIKIGSEKTFYVPATMSKGYGSGQAIYSQIKDTTYSPYQNKDVAYLTWQLLTYQALFNTYSLGIESSAASELQELNFIEKHIAEMMDGIATSIRSLLGLVSIPELMMNGGIGKVSNWRGVMPSTLYQISVTMHVILQLLAWLAIGIAFAKLLALRNLSAVNPQLRVDFVEGLMNLIVTGFLLLSALPILGAMAMLNESLVNFFSGMSAYTSLYGSSSLGIQNGTIAGAFVSLIFMGVEAYFNFFYIIRGLTMGVLFAIAPLAIVTIAFGAKYKEVFSNYMKTLVGTLYIQAIHALILAIYSMFLAKGGANGSIYMLILYFSFIPVTKMIRDEIMKVGGGSIDRAAGGATTASTATMTAGANLASAGTKIATSAPQGIKEHAASFPGSSGGGGSAGSSKGGGLSSGADLMDKPKGSSSGSGTMPSGGSGGIQKQSAFGAAKQSLQDKASGFAEKHPNAAKMGESLQKGGRQAAEVGKWAGSGAAKIAKNDDIKSAANAFAQVNASFVDSSSGDSRAMGGIDRNGNKARRSVADDDEDHFNFNDFGD